MKRLLLILILTLSFHSLTIANDISDIEIEGVSIGDNLLNHYDKETLNKIKKFYYPGSKKYLCLASNIFSQNLKEYEGMQFCIDPNTYEIANIAGKIYKYQNNKTECYKKMETIFEDISSSFPNLKTKKFKEGPHTSDKSGESLAKVYSIFFKDGRLSITCTDWSKKMKRSDSLKIALHKSSYMKWINTEAHK
jgi:hypothetical protein